MMKTILVLALVAGIIMLSGCAGSGSQAGNQPADGSYGTAPAPNDGGAGSAAQQQYAGGSGRAQGFGNRSGMMRNGSGMGGRGGFGNGNITDAQRQQMMQAWAAACDGKAAGDACTAQSTLGGGAREMNGTCSARSGNLTCTPSGMMGGRNGTDGRGWQGNGTAGNAGQPSQVPGNP